MHGCVEKIWFEMNLQHAQHMQGFRNNKMDKYPCILLAKKDIQKVHLLTHCHNKT